ncbi:hypothetical protein J6590_068776 [Homalodisca vitripennis]|nr:hypothetical protein J6590_091731 [Homalodisca vitripennis]KAG8335414.1 hypothetical protein J6590_068776 [Homalodisca vitripennis]
MTSIDSMFSAKFLDIQVAQAFSRKVVSMKGHLCGRDLHRQSFLKISVAKRNDGHVTGHSPRKREWNLIPELPKWKRWGEKPSYKGVLEKRNGQVIRSVSVLGLDDSSHCEFANPARVAKSSHLVSIH